MIITHRFWLYRYVLPGLMDDGFPCSRLQYDKRPPGSNRRYRGLNPNPRGTRSEAIFAPWSNPILGVRGLILGFTTGKWTPGKGRYSGNRHIVLGGKARSPQSNGAAKKTFCAFYFCIGVAPHDIHQHTSRKTTVIYPIGSLPQQNNRTQQSNCKITFIDTNTRKTSPEVSREGPTLERLKELAGSRNLRTLGI